MPLILAFVFPGAIDVARRLLIPPLVALAAYYLLLFIWQRSLIYPAPKGEFAGAVPADAQPLSLTGANRQPVRAWYLPPVGTQPTAVAIFCHGNGERAEEWLSQFGPLRVAGLGVVVLEYPGYGVARGSPSEESLTSAAVAAYDWVRAAPGLSETPVVVHGRSLGGGVATRLAARRQAAALILESSFTDLRSFASRFLVPGFLVRDRYDSIGELQHYKGPLLVLHGEHDEQAPFAGGRALARAVAGAQFIPMRCGHNDCVRPWPTILTFLRSRGLARPAA